MIQPINSPDHVSTVKISNSSRPSMKGLRQPSLQDCMVAYGSRSNRSKRHLLNKHTSSKDVMICNQKSYDPMQSESSLHDSTVSSRHTSLNNSSQGSIVEQKPPSLQECMEAYGTPTRPRMQNDRLHESMNFDRREHLLRKASSRRFGTSSRNLMSA